MSAVLTARAVLVERRARIEAVIGAMDALIEFDTGAPPQADLRPLAPQHLKLPKPAAGKKKAKGAGKRQGRAPAEIDEDLFRKLWLDPSLGSGDVAKRFGRTSAWPQAIARRFKLPVPKPKTKAGDKAAPTAKASNIHTPAAGTALTPKQTLAFLSEAGHVVSGPNQAGRYTVEKRTDLDAIGVLEIANAWRKKNGQPPFRLAAP